MSHPFLALPRPIAIGHRGCAGEIPENTVASFERGLANGAQILETDVHLTRNGIPVLIHDDEVDRITEAQGRVSAFSWDDLRALDAGHRFQPEAAEGFPFRAAGHHIPSLREALTTFPDARFNLELKEGLPGTVEQTLAVIREQGADERTLLTAAEDEIMAAVRDRVKRAGARVALGASAGEVGRFAVSALRGEPAPEGPMALQIPTEFAGRPLVTSALVEHAHAHGVQIHVWTINDTVEMTRLLDLGVDGIVSDFPVRVVELGRARARP